MLKIKEELGFRTVWGGDFALFFNKFEKESDAG